jgi:5-methylcytosine-specific restriction endonuclease McrA
MIMMAGERIRVRRCFVCKDEFSYSVGKGTDRKHCSDKCRYAHRLELRRQRLPYLAQCKGIRCTGKATRLAAGLCERCYCYTRRTGLPPEVHPRKYKRCKTKAGYIKIWKPGHPLVDGSRLVFEHRVVAYDAFGPGEQLCFWCGTALPWARVVVDHLNEKKDDNRIENLVIACNKCNRARGAMLPFVRGIRDEALKVFVSMLPVMRRSTP